MELAIRSLHLVAAAVWAGGLVTLALVAASARRAVDERERIELFRVVGRRFLVLSLAAAAILALSGAEMAADRLASWSALVDTPYGRTLLAKTVLFAIALTLALTHALAIGPRTRALRRASLARPGDAELERRLRIATRLGGTVNGLVLALTLAILVLAAELLA